MADNKEDRKKLFMMEALATSLFEGLVDYSHGKNIKFTDLTFCGFDILKEHQIIIDIQDHGR